MDFLKIYLDLYIDATGDDVLILDYDYGKI